MYRYKKIMVHLNLDEQDDNLIAYAGFISRMAKSEEICFVHVSDTFDIPDEIKRIYPELVSPVETAVENRMKEVVEKQFAGNHETQLTFKALEGSLLGLLVSGTKEFDIDLLIIAHSRNDGSSNYNISEKLARKAFCSVLMVPQNTRVSFDKIMIAVDFSDHSLNALDVGSAFAKAAGLDDIYILNTYGVPEGFFKTGKSYEEFSDVMLENAKTKLRSLLPRVDLKSMAIKPYFKKSKNVVKGIKSFSDELGASLVVVGARGRSGDISAILLGSITEGLIRTLDRPLLAVKNKGEGMNILEAISSV